VMECNLTGERREGLGRMSGAVSCCQKNVGNYVCGIVSPGDLGSMSWCSPSLSQVEVELFPF
jgi:hypothetical protein